jgi:hypothetical protein
MLVLRFMASCMFIVLLAQTTFAQCGSGGGGGSRSGGFSSGMAMAGISGGYGNSSPNGYQQYNIIQQQYAYQQQQQYAAARQTELQRQAEEKAAKKAYQRQMWLAHKEKEAARLAVAKEKRLAANSQ